MALWPPAVTQIAYACFDFLKEMAAAAAATTVVPVAVAATSGSGVYAHVSPLSRVRPLCVQCVKVSRHVQHNALRVCMTYKCRPCTCAHAHTWI